MPEKEAARAAIEQNLALLDARIAGQAERYPAWLTEMAAEDASLLHDRSEAASTVLRRLGERFTSPTLGTGHLAEYRAALQSTLHQVRAIAYPTYIRALCATVPLQDTDFLQVAKTSGGRVHYFKNAYTDEAYEEFAEMLDGPTVSYTSSFRASCEEVAGHDADFCILPYENGDGFLPGFTAMAERHHLYCVATCRVFHADGTDVTHFGLYGRQMLSPADWAVCHLQYSLPMRKAGDLAAHVAAVPVLSAEVEHLVWLPNEEGDDMRLFATVRLRPATLTVFLAYLSAFWAGYTIHGLYREKET